MTDLNDSPRSKYLLSTNRCNGRNRNIQDSRQHGCCCCCFQPFGVVVIQSAKPQSCLVMTKWWKKVCACVKYCFHSDVSIPLWNSTAPLFWRKSGFFKKTFWLLRKWRLWSEHASSVVLQLRNIWTGSSWDACSTFWSGAGSFCVQYVPSRPGLLKNTSSDFDVYLHNAAARRAGGPMRARCIFLLLCRVFGMMSCNPP